MTGSRLFILISLAILLGVPLLFRAEEKEAASGDAAHKLIIITPHNEQIRYEFSRGFDRWHRRNFGQPVNVIYNVPGGTSEIRKMLEAQFLAAMQAGREPGGEADLIFGGGSFEHGRLKRGVQNVSITVPVDFSDEWLAQTYGENRIGDEPLYDTDKHWFGLALSGFGIVYNNDVLRALEALQPYSWKHLCDPRLQGWVALVNPGQAGSITTAFEAILKQHGWEEGWQILRRAGANARYFSGSALKPSIDVSQGNAGMGVSIDFFGRYQSQALREAGDAERMGYIDPPGATTIDADPISMLRNAPNAVVAKRFIEFCLSEEGQALWQLPRLGSAILQAGGSPGSESRGTRSLGPERYELRRLPIRRSFYERYFDRFIDRVNPFETAAPAAHPSPHYRDFIAPLFAAMAMDNHRELREAWRAIANHPAMPAGSFITAAEVVDPTLRQMLELFDAMPSVATPSGERVRLDDAVRLGEVRAGWLRGEWAEARLWHPETTPADHLRREFGRFFRDNYRRIVQMAEE